MISLINFVPNTKIKASEVNDNFDQIAEELSLTQGTVTQLNTLVTNGCVPTGAVFWFGGLTAPTGYLVCDGSAVSRSTYAVLYTQIGTTYGAGDGTTTFNLPNLTDSRYIQGGTSVGTQLDAGLPDLTTSTTGAHTHLYTYPSIGGGYQGTGPNTSLPLVTPGVETSSNGNHSHTISWGATTDTVQPKSLVLLPCIKY